MRSMISLVILVSSAVALAEHGVSGSPGNYSGAGFSRAPWALNDCPNVNLWLTKKPSTFFSSEKWKVELKLQDGSRTFEFAPQSDWNTSIDRPEFSQIRARRYEGYEGDTWRAGTLNYHLDAKSQVDRLIIPIGQIDRDKKTGIRSFHVVVITRDGDYAEMIIKDKANALVETEVKQVCGQGELAKKLSVGKNTEAEAKPFYTSAWDNSPLPVAPWGTQGRKNSHYDKEQQMLGVLIDQKLQSLPERKPVDATSSIAKK